MDFLRLDDNKPDEIVSGWEQFFTGNETGEQGLNAPLRRGFYDYYPLKDVKAGATVVARYLEPQVSENTFDKKEPPFIVTYKYGQGMTAFPGFLRNLAAASSQGCLLRALLGENDPLPRFRQPPQAEPPRTHPHVEDLLDRRHSCAGRLNFAAPT